MREKYFICGHCGELTTHSEILRDIETSGGSGMCLCEFTRPVWSEKYNDLDVETPRILHPYLEISRKWFDMFKENKDIIWRLEAFRQIPTNKLLSNFHIKVENDIALKEVIR